MTALSPVLNNVPVCKYSTDEIFNKYATASAFLPRIQLFTSRSKQCSKGFPINSWGLVLNADQIEDLTGEVEVFPLAWRPKAMRIDGKNVTTKYNHQDPDFKKFEALAEDPNSGCMVGLEFLVWIPSVRRFAGLFMASKSAKRECLTLRDKMQDHEPVTLGSQFIEGKKFSWQAPTVRACSSPFGPNDFPNEVDLATELNKFNNPPESKIEVVEDSEQNGQGNVRER